MNVMNAQRALEMIREQQIQIPDGANTYDTAVLTFCALINLGEKESFKGFKTSTFDASMHDLGEARSLDYKVIHDSMDKLPGWKRFLLDGNATGNNLYAAKVMDSSSDMAFSKFSAYVTEFIDAKKAELLKQLEDEHKKECKPYSVVENPMNNANNLNLRAGRGKKSKTVRVTLPKTHLSGNGDFNDTVKSIMADAPPHYKLRTVTREHGFDIG